MLLRYQFVEEFKRFYPEAKIVQVEAPVEILIERIANRGDTIRVNANEMREEIIAGRGKVTGLVDTSRAFVDTYRVFESFCR